MTDIEKNVEKLLKELPAHNPQGERVKLVAAVKTQTPEAINRAVRAGVNIIGDNHVQEFRDKYDLIEGNPERHFIGHLQTNKVKYLIGRTDLYHSVDRYNLAEEISRRSAAAGTVSRVLVQINIGCEQTKGGFDLSQADEAVARIAELPAMEVRGLMAMLPFTDDESELERLARAMRSKYDELKAVRPQFEYLSMGMSGDWKLCIECGSNMVRIGTAIFGERHYDK